MPRMYYRDLASLEQILHGHSVAFSQLGVVEKREEMFNHAFAAWLRRREGASVASGWSHACLALASRAGQDAERLFAVQVRDFLRQWTDNEAS